MRLAVASSLLIIGLGLAQPLAWAKAVRPIPPDTLVTVLDRPVRTTFPWTSPDASAHPVTNLLFETLLERHWETGDLAPRLAKKWEWNAAAQTITFHLDERARFWNGEPVTADDVVFSYEVLDEPDLHTEPWLTHYLFVEEAKAKGQHTVVFKLQGFRYPYLEALGKLRIFSRRHYRALLDEDSGLKRRESLEKPMGSGPWKLERWQDDEVLLGRWEDYWDKERFQREGRWTHSKRLIRVIESREAQIEALKKREISVLSLTVAEFLKAKEDPTWPKDVLLVEAESKIPPSFDFIAWNHRNALLSSQDVRWALAHLVDLQGWIERFDAGYTRPTIGPYSPRSDFHEPKLEPIPFSLDEARKRLASAGFKPGKDGILIDERGERLTLEILYPSKGGGSYGPKIHDLKEKAAKVGIEIKPRAGSWQEINHALMRKSFDGVVLSWTRSHDAGLRPWFHPDEVVQGSNFINFRQHSVTLLVEQLDATFDRSKRREVARKLQNAIYVYQPYTFLTEYKKDLYAVDRALKRPADSLPYQLGLAFWRY